MNKVVDTIVIGGGIIWPNGIKEPVDTVIFATGYRPHIPYLQAIGALDAEGRQRLLLESCYVI
jgi:lysine/ornithine N-monooxygenase